jgi:hypothetical protein
MAGSGGSIAGLGCLRALTWWLWLRRSAPTWSGCWDDFDRLVANVGTRDLDAPTSGTRWTNRELLFHPWFGQRIARSLAPLIGGFSRLPPGASQVWARLLAGVTKPYEWVKHIASAAGGRIVPVQVTRAWIRRDTNALIRWAEQVLTCRPRPRNERAARLGSPFLPWMNRTDLLACESPGEWWGFRFRRG